MENKAGMPAAIPEGDISCPDPEIPKKQTRKTWDGAWRKGVLECPSRAGEGPRREDVRLFEGIRIMRGFQ